jgi:hypothetical protein
LVEHSAVQSDHQPLHQRHCTRRLNMATQQTHPGPGDDDYLAARFPNVGRIPLTQLFKNKEFLAAVDLPDGQTETQRHRWESNREKEVYDAIITKKLPSGRILQPASEHLGKVNRGFAIQNLDMPRWVYRYIGVLSKVAHWKLENEALRPTERARRTHRDVSSAATCSSAKSRIP